MSRPIRTDALSLTLPVRLRSKARRRRRPPRVFWLYAAFAVWCVAFTVLDVLLSYDVFAVWQMIGAVYYWCLAWRVFYRALPPDSWLYFLMIWLGVGLALLMAGVQ